MAKPRRRSATTTRKRGRPSLLTKEVHEAIVDALRKGAFKRHAAWAAGVSEDALAEWVSRGEAGEEPYVDFAREVRRLVGVDAVRNQAVITAAAVKPVSGDWKAAVWNLETKHPTLYGRAAATAIAAAVTIQPQDSDDPDAPPKTRVEFYLPTNGRRPDDGKDDA